MGFEGACWNFHESGHGKGTPDAVGGSLKRTADTRVRCGEDITCAAKFKEILDKTGTTVTLFEEMNVVDIRVFYLNVIKNRPDVCPNS
jgi:hypothetical protein